MRACPSPRWGEGHALILGGGIAGCTLARALAERGVQVTLLERGIVAGGASGNAGAVLFPQLTKRWTVSAAWYFAAYGFMLQQLGRWRKAGLEFTAEECGMLRLPRHAEEEAQLRALTETLGLDAGIVHWIEAEEAAARSGVALGSGGAYFSRGTWLAPAELCRALLQHPNIMLRENAAAISCVREGGNWVVETEMQGDFSAPHLCIANSHEAAAFFPEFDLRLHAVGGQVSEVAGAADLGLRTILCHKGYVIPLGQHLLIGATYNHGEDALAVTAENHRKNMDEVANFLPSLAQAPVIGGRTSLRATTPDRLPYVGRLAEGLWVSAGHGSRGMLSAPLAAAVVASEMLGEQVPLAGDLRKAVNPLRFTKA